MAELLLGLSIEGRAPGTPFELNGRAPSWALHDLGKEGRAPGTPFKLNRRAADLHDDDRAPSWAASP